MTAGTPSPGAGRGNEYFVSAGSAGVGAVAPSGQVSVEPTAEAESQILAAAIEMLLQLEGCEALKEAADDATRILCELMSAQRVLIGWLNESGHQCKLLSEHDSSGWEAASGLRDEDPTRRAAAAALDEVVIRGRMTNVMTDGDQPAAHAQLALRQFALLIKAQSLLGTPLLDKNGVCQGACIVLDPAKRKDGLSPDRILDALARPLGARLNSIHQSRRSRLDQGLRRAKDFCTGARWKLLVAGLLLSVGAALFPIPYRIGCDCLLQPVSRRFIAAPFDGSLKESLVQPGDLVSQDQLLARMSARELDWELAGLKADLNRSDKERKVSLAKQDLAQSQIAELESQRIRSKARLLENRVANLEIKSPIKGVVVVGDIKEVEGAPLKTGQTLFEIAPTGKMIVELLVPEEDFVYVQQGMSVSLRLNAFPTERVTGIVERINPKAEIVEQQNVFVVEMSLDDPHAIYRPGMHGRASIQARRRPLVWVMLHKPWHAVLMWFGW